MRFFNRSIFVLALLAAATGVEAQVRDSRIQRENTGVGTGSGEFLLLGAGARGMALGPASAAVTRDVDALYYNPANLPLMDGRQVGLTVMPYFADTRYMWVGVGLPVFGGDYAVGFSIANFSYRLDGEGRVRRHSMVIRTTDRNSADRLSDTLENTESVLEFRIAPTGD